MGGGLMQLVAYGAQDVYLTGNPQITFFKVVYRRHTNFSMECIEQTWSGNSIADGRCVATISRNGDLIHKMHLQLDIGATNENFNNISDYIDYVEVEIGGQKIDRQSGAYMQAYNEVRDEVYGWGEEVGVRSPTQSTLKLKTYGHGLDSDQSKFIPLNFWFCKNAGLALPLIALQYHEVKVILSHRLTTRFTNLAGAFIGGNDMNILRNTLWVDYIYLDTDERRRFAQVSHEYLIEQVQERRLQSTARDHELNFNHPVKELIWAGNHENTAAPAADGDIGLAGTSINNVTATAACTFHLKLNGHDRFSPRQSTYFSRLQVNEYHSGYGGLNVQGANAGATGVQKSNGGGCLNGICVYSFALKPEEHQPSGTCNFSRIDSAHLVSSEDLIGTVDCYAINYNVLRIMSGMGGLAYSN